MRTALISKAVNKAFKSVFHAGYVYVPTPVMVLEEHDGVTSFVFKDPRELMSRYKASDFKLSVMESAGIDIHNLKPAGKLYGDVFEILKQFDNVKTE